MKKILAISILTLFMLGCATFDLTYTHNFQKDGKSYSIVTTAMNDGYKVTVVEGTKVYQCGFVKEDGTKDKKFSVALTENGVAVSYNGMKLECSLE